MLRGGTCLEDVCACALTCGECPATLHTCQMHHPAASHQERA